MAKLAVEVDGSSHAGHENARRDFARDKWHQDEGITTIRVSVRDVMWRRGSVVARINRAVKDAGCETDRRTRREFRRAVKAGRVYTGPDIEAVLDASERPIEVRDAHLTEALQRYGRIPKRDDLIPEQRLPRWEQARRKASQ